MKTLRSRKVINGSHPPSTDNMENIPGISRKQLERSFTQRFESTEQLRERLTGMQEGKDSPPETGSARDPGDDVETFRLPSVEEMHMKMLSGLQGRLEARPVVPTPSGRGQRREADDRE